jgi:hypothetical protein
VTLTDHGEGTCRDPIALVPGLVKLGDTGQTAADKEQKVRLLEVRALLGAGYSDAGLPHRPSRDGAAEAFDFPADRGSIRSRSGTPCSSRLTNSSVDILAMEDSAPPIFELWDVTPCKKHR